MLIIHAITPSVHDKDMIFESKQMLHCATSGHNNATQMLTGKSEKMIVVCDRMNMIMRQVA